MSAFDVAASKNGAAVRDDPDATPSGRQSVFNVEGQAPGDTSLEGIEWAKTTAELGGTLRAVATVSHEIAEANVGQEWNLVGYLSDLMPQTTQRTVILDETGTFDFTIQVPIPNNTSWVGDQWMYAGIEASDGSPMFLRGHGVTIEQGGPIEGPVVRELRIGTACSHQGRGNVGRTRADYRITFAEGITGSRKLEENQEEISGGTITGQVVCGFDFVSGQGAATIENDGPDTLIVDGDVDRMEIPAGDSRTIGGDGGKLPDLPNLPDVTKASTTVPVLLGLASGGAAAWLKSRR